MTEPLPPFGSASLKLWRASRHIKELELAIATFLASNPFAIVLEQPPECVADEVYVLVTKIRSPVPPELATIIGDIVHNLRSALDLLATDLVRLNGQRADSVYFPFAKSADGIEQQIKAKNLHRAHPDAVDLVRSLKPFTGGNHALRGLHDLDIQDKHQALIPSGSGADIAPIPLKFSHDDPVDRDAHPFPGWKSLILQDGWWMVMMPAVVNIPLGTEIAAKFTLVFRQNTPFAGREIIPTLHRLHDNVASILEAFATLCHGQTFPESAASRPGPSGGTVILTGTFDTPHLATRIIEFARRVRMSHPAFST